MRKVCQGLLNVIRSRGVTGQGPISLQECQEHIKQLVAQEENVDLSRLYSGKCLTLDAPTPKNQDSIAARLAALEKKKDKETPKKDTRRRSGDSGQQHQICRKFNSTDGCKDGGCVRRHVCNYRTGAGPCGLHHTRAEHQ